MRFAKSLPGGLLMATLVTVVVGAGALAIRVRHVSCPPRSATATLGIPESLVRMEPVRFPASDGIELAGWLMKGKPHGGTILLCHDLGQSKASLLNLSIQLQRMGYTLLAFDFRGHGESGGERSTFGLAEKRDVIGAVDYLAGLERDDARRLGIYGAGMGAYAAALAAADRPALRVLVLDSLYPDVDYQVVRRVYENWSFGVAHLAMLPTTVFRFTRGGGVATERASDVLPRLAGRSLLMVAPAGDAALAEEMERMYRSLPERHDSDGNLVTLPTVGTGGVYGADLDRYLDRVSSFFHSRL